MDVNYLVSVDATQDRSVKSSVTNLDPLRATACGVVAAVMLIGFSSVMPVVLADSDVTPPQVQTASSTSSQAPSPTSTDTIKFVLTTDKSSYSLEEPISVKTVFINDGEQSTDIVWPAGADVRRVFRYEIVDLKSYETWQGEPIDDRGDGGDSKHTVAAGERLERSDNVLRFRVAGGQWIPSLPAGDFKLTAKYDGKRARDPENQTALTLKSEPVQFSIKAD